MSVTTKGGFNAKARRGFRRVTQRPVRRGGKAEFQVVCPGKYSPLLTCGCSLCVTLRNPLRAFALKRGAKPEPSTANARQFPSADQRPQIAHEWVETEAPWKSA